MLIRLLCMLSLFAVACTAKAATISVIDRSAPSGTWILIAGNLAATDYQQFERIVATEPKAVIGFVSDGGNVIAGIKIGRLIRMKNFSTLVVDKTRCASACALAWLGGTQRFMGTRALIGFHAAYDAMTGQESGEANALVGAYLHEIGLPYSAVSYITHMSPGSMKWLTKADAEIVGIDVIVPRAATDQDNLPPQSKLATVAEPPLRLHDLAKEFIASLYRTISGPTDISSSTLEGIFAETVRYYGKEMSREQVIAQVQSFLARWPIRQYRVKERTARFDCDENALTCSVTGVVQFDAQSPIRNQRSTGEATFVYLLQFSPDHKIPQIIAEGGKPLTRSIGALSSEANASPLNFFDHK
jgi:hypothetical protein